MSVLKHSVSLIVFVLLAICAQFFLVPFLDPYFLDIVLFAGINIVLAVSLNLVNGFTGQFSIGHAGFMAVGGYTAAVITMQLGAGITNPVAQQFLFFAATVAGGLAASFAGIIVGLPSLRLKGDYLAIVTLGFGEIIRVLLLNINAVGGARGLPSIPNYANLAWIAAWAAFTTFVIWRLVRSPHGRSFQSIREDEVAAEAMGVYTTKTKVRAFTMGAFFAGIAGSLYGHKLGILNPSTFDFNKSFEVVIMVVLGGMGSITGSVVAAILLTVLKEALRPLQQITHIDFRMVFYSLFLITLMLTRPNGMFGSREWTDLFKRKKDPKVGGV